LSGPGTAAPSERHEHGVLLEIRERFEGCDPRTVVEGRSLDRPCQHEWTSPAWNGTAIGAARSRSSGCDVLARVTGGSQRAGRPTPGRLAPGADGIRFERATAAGGSAARSPGARMIIPRRRCSSAIWAGSSPAPHATRFRMPNGSAIHPMNTQPLPGRNKPSRYLADRGVTSRDPAVAESPPRRARPSTCAGLRSRARESSPTPMRRPGSGHLRVRHFFSPDRRTPSGPLTAVRIPLRSAAAPLDQSMGESRPSLPGGSEAASAAGEEARRIVRRTAAYNRRMTAGTSSPTGIQKR
jgi:hypothetical protein